MLCNNSHLFSSGAESCSRVSIWLEKEVKFGIWQHSDQGPFFLCFVLLCLTNYRMPFASWWFQVICNFRRINIWKSWHLSGENLLTFKVDQRAYQVNLPKEERRTLKDGTAPSIKPEQERKCQVFLWGWVKKAMVVLDSLVSMMMSELSQ